LGDYDIEDRLGFIRKVYGILTVQLLFTFGCIAATKLDDDTNAFMKGQTIIAITLLIVSIIPQIMIICCRSVARKVPTNYILLLVFTLCWAFFFSWVCAQYTA